MLGLGPLWTRSLGAREPVGEAAVDARVRRDVLLLILHLLCYVTGQNHLRCVKVREIRHGEGEINHQAVMRGCRVDMMEPSALPAPAPSVVLALRSEIRRGRNHGRRSRST
jgi:hypothetical protein